MTVTTRRGPRPQKREAITRAARTVFARDGYARASVDAIAAEAGVSTRTIYNHFESKQQLFVSVLQTSATQVADGFVANVARWVTGNDLEGDLVAIGWALIAQQTDFPEHFAMVRQILPEAPHFPPAVLEAWQDAGPRRVEHEVARRVGQLAEQGLLRVEDPAQAAVHLIALTALPITTRARYGEPPPIKGDTTRIITAGVHAFLHGYATDP
jgi:AcrR family transcriptional regulator